LDRRWKVACRAYLGVFVVPNLSKLSASLSVLLLYASANAQEDNLLQSTEPSALVDESKTRPDESAVPNESTIDTSKAETAWVNRTRRILEIGSEVRTTTEERTKAYKELEELKPKDEDDIRLSFAFLLVAIFEKQYPQAQARAAEILKNDSYYVPARVANARLLLTTDKKLPAIAELESLAKGLGAPSKTVSQDQLIAAASFLGLAVGYLEGPAKESMKPTSLKALIAVAEKIPTPLLEMFAQSRALVGEEYQVLMDKGEEALKQLRTESAKKAEEMRAQLEASKEQTMREAEATKQQLEASFAQSQSAWSSAWSRSQAITRSINSLQSQQAQFITSLSLLRPPRIDQNGNIDRNDERRYLNEKLRLDNAIFNLDSQINQLSLQYDQVQSIGMAAENRMNFLRQQGQRLGLNLSSQNESFAKIDRTIRGKEEAAKKAEAKTSAGKLRKARSFSTYDDFNFYKEQSMLLETLPKS
jgi:hypothetical protein